MLILYNGYGHNLTYGRQALSVNSYNKQSSQLITDLNESKLQLISDNILADTQYSIYDISGRLIFSSSLNESKNISINTLITGVYFLNIQNSKNQIERFKFVKD